jgi:isopenicillin N synthase-like dioxygenase
MQVLTRLLRAFALALGQPADALEPLYGDDPHYLIKLIRYPGHDVSARQGVGAHRPGTFVINIGELLERLRSHPDVAQRHHADLLKSEKSQ